MSLGAIYIYGKRTEFLDTTLYCELPRKLKKFNFSSNVENRLISFFMHDSKLRYYTYMNITDNNGVILVVAAAVWNFKTPEAIVCSMILALKNNSTYRWSKEMAQVAMIEHDRLLYT
jgi:hypothetical protein